MQTWQIVLLFVAVPVVTFLVIMQTPWFRVRKYAMDVKKIFDKYKLEEKLQGVQLLAQNPNQNPVLVRKPLRELVDTYKSLIADLEKLKPPAKAKELHEATLEMHRESLNLYQMAMVHGFRQKSILEKQKKLMQMERAVNEKMEKIYGPLKKPEKK